MQNSDLIPRKEVEKMIEKMIGENEFGKGIDYSEDYCKGLKQLLQKFKS